MSKDPAFLFYPNDYLGGTMGMTFEQKGAYIDLLIFQFNNHHFTEAQAQAVTGCLWDNIKSKFTIEEEVYFFNIRLREEKQKRQNYTESRRQSRLKCDEDNVRIYLLKDLDSGLIKIGSSVNPLRRYNEITNQTKSVSGSSDNRNYKLIWYSEPTTRKIELELHDLFKENRFEGEWFKLNNSDILELKSFIDKTYVNNQKTYVQRTIERTGNENENRNRNSSINTNKCASKFDQFWKAYPRKKSKGQAVTAFKKLNPDEQLLATMIAKIEQAKTQDQQWLKDNGMYIPYPATWLNSMGWLDEIKSGGNNAGINTNRGNRNQKVYSEQDRLADEINAEYYRRKASETTDNTTGDT